MPRRTGLVEDVGEVGSQRRDRNAMLLGHHGIPGEHALKRAQFGGRLLSHFDRIVLS